MNIPAGAESGSRWISGIVGRSESGDRCGDCPACRLNHVIEFKDTTLGDVYRKISTTLIARSVRDLEDCMIVGDSASNPKEKSRQFRLPNLRSAALSVSGLQSDHMPRDKNSRSRFVFPSRYAHNSRPKMNAL